jgi:hypothetical protein
MRLPYRPTTIPPPPHWTHCMGRQKSSLPTTASWLLFPISAPRVFHALNALKFAWTPLYYLVLSPTIPIATNSPQAPIQAQDFCLPTICSHQFSHSCIVGTVTLVLREMNKISVLRTNLLPVWTTIDEASIVTRVPRHRDTTAQIYA